MNPIETYIRVIVDKYVSNVMSFTSVDVANEAKKWGCWISSSTASTILKDISWDDFDYTSSHIKVGSDNRRIAILYHHKNTKPSTYTSRDIKAIQPIEFYESIFGANPSSRLVADENNNKVSYAEVEIKYVVTQSVTGNKAMDLIEFINKQK